MKLAVWAREKDITYKTAWRMYKTGKIPHPTEQLPTGTIIVYPEQNKTPPKVVIYARVSSYDQKEDLERQLQRLRDYIAKQGYNITKEITEIGSGLNGTMLLSILSSIFICSSYHSYKTKNNCQDQLMLSPIVQWRQ